MKLYNIILLLFPTLVLADPNMPDRVGTFYLFIYISIGIVILLLLYLTFYIVIKVSHNLKTKSNIPDNKVLIQTLRWFSILSFGIYLVLTANIFMSYNTLDMLTNFNVYFAVVLIFIQRLHKNIFIQIAFYLVLISLTFKFLLLFSEQILLNDIFDIFITPLLLLSFYKVEQDLLRREKIIKVTIAFVVFHIITNFFLAYIYHLVLNIAVISIYYGALIYLSRDTISYIQHNEKMA